MGKFRLARHRKHERRLQRQLRDARALLVRIPRQNIVVTASPGLSVAVLPESLDGPVGMLSTVFFFTCLYMSPILRIHSPWFAQFRYPYQGFLIVWLILLIVWSIYFVY